MKIGDRGNLFPAGDRFKRGIRSMAGSESTTLTVFTVYLDIEGAEERYSLELVETLTPETILDARWAMALLGEAMKRLSRDYLAQGKEATFEVLNAFVDPINSKGLPTYEEVADRLKISVSSVKTMIHRFRKQYAVFVRDEINRTVVDSDEVDTEIHQLCEALIAAKGWISA
jgi:hypothetical protein